MEGVVRRRLYQMQSATLPVSLFDTTRTPYPPRMGMMSYVGMVRSTFDILNDMEEWQALAPLYTEPLLDMPARWDFTPHDHGDKERWRAKWDAAILSQEQVLSNLLVLTEVPDTTPLFVGRLLDEAGMLWKGVRDAKTLAAILAGDERGTPRFLVPASVWTCTVQHILSAIQRHLLEPTIDGGVSWQLWQEVEVIHYLRERIARFLVETGMVQDRSTLTTIAAQGEYDLPTTLAELKRVALTNQGLYPMDFWQADYGKTGWDQSTGTPYGYLENVEQLSLQLVPSPTTGGETVSLHMVKSTPFDPPVEDAAAEEDLSVAEVLANYRLRLPGIFCWAIKYGVMADMLKKEGEANDPQRAEWCEQRFRDGIEIGKILVGYPVSGGQR